MRRKVSRIGASTLMVSLPSKWCKIHGLKKGDEVEVGVSDSAITILPKEKRITPERASVDVSNVSDDMLRRLLAVYHKIGFDEIEILFSDAKQFQTIRDRIKSTLVGYEIIEQSNKRCIIKYLAGEGKTDLDPIIRRIFLVLQSFAEESKKAIADGRYGDIEELFVLEETINRLSNLAERYIHQESNKTSKAIFLYIIIWVLESIGDDYRDLCRYFCKRNSKTKLGKDALLLYQQVNDIVRLYYECYYKFSMEAFDSLIRQQELLARVLEKKRGSLSEEDDVMVMYLARINARIENLFGSTLGLFI